MTAISVDEFLTNPVNYLKLAYTTELIIQDLNGKRLSIHEEPEEEFADPLTPEEEKAVAIAEAQHARGEYYTWDPEKESLEAFFDRIDADPEGTMACNQPEWRERKIVNN